MVNIGLFILLSLLAAGQDSTAGNPNSSNTLVQTNQDSNDLSDIKVMLDPFTVSPDGTVNMNNKEIKYQTAGVYTDPSYERTLQKTNDSQNKAVPAVNEQTNLNNSNPESESNNTETNSGSQQSESNNTSSDGSKNKNSPNIPTTNPPEPTQPIGISIPLSSPTQTTNIPESNSNQTTSTVIPVSNPTETTSASNPLPSITQSTTTSDSTSDSAQTASNSNLPTDSAQATSTSDTVSDTEQETNTSNSVSDTKETSTSNPVPDTEPETSSSNPVSNTEQETSSSNPVSVTKQETSTSKPAPDTEQETSTSSPLSDTKQETSTSNPISDPIQATSTSNLVSDSAQETNILIPLSDQDKTETTTSNMESGSSENDQNSNIRSNDSSSESLSIDHTQSEDVSAPKTENLDAVENNNDLHSESQVPIAGESSSAQVEAKTNNGNESSGSNPSVDNKVVTSTSSQVSGESSQVTENVIIDDYNNNQVTGNNKNIPESSNENTEETRTLDNKETKNVNDDHSDPDQPLEPNPLPIIAVDPSDNYRAGSEKDSFHEPTEHVAIESSSNIEEKTEIESRESNSPAIPKLLKSLPVQKTEELEIASQPEVGKYLPLSSGNDKMVFDEVFELLPPYLPANNGDCDCIDASNCVEQVEVLVECIDGECSLVHITRTDIDLDMRVGLIAYPVDENEGCCS